MTYLKVNSNCNGCLACMQNCPANAIDVRDTEKERRLLHNMARCARCGTCWRVCPQEAIEFEHMLQNQWDDVIVLELEHCTVCGEALFTSAFSETVAGKIGESGTTLCVRHREALALKAKTHFIGAKSDHTR